MLTKEYILQNIKDNIGQTFYFPFRRTLHSFVIDRVESDDSVILKYVIKGSSIETKDDDPKEDKVRSISIKMIYNSYVQFYRTNQFEIGEDKHGDKKLIKALITDDRIAPRYIYINSYRVKIKRTLNKEKSTEDKDVYEISFECLEQPKDRDGNPIPIILNDSLETHTFPDIFKPSRRIGNKYEICDSIIKIDFTYCPLAIRKQLYKDGFTIDGIKYIRYKRTASASRQGTCLFIKEEHYDVLTKWSESIVSFKNNKNCRDKLKKNYSSFEAYKSLTLSSAENFFDYNPKNILVINDEDSEFIGNERSKYVIRVSLKKQAEKNSQKYKELIKSTNNFLAAKPKLVECGDVVAFQDEAQIKNKIWDGEGLADESLFKDEDKKFLFRPNDTAPYENHGMMFVRNRFFKSCLFNTKLQLFIKEVILKPRGIDINEEIKNHPNVLNGFTLAERFSDIKIVVTHSSLKFLKFFDDNEKEQQKQIEAWMKDICYKANVSRFAVTKTDKDTPYKYEDESQLKTSYQLLNTLDLDENLIKEAFGEYIDTLRKAQYDEAEYMKFLERISQADKEIPFSYYLSLRTCKDIAIDRLIKHNYEFLKLPKFEEHTKGLVETYINNAKKGKLIINGTIATLFGNPYCFLNAIIKGNMLENMEPDLGCGEVYCKGFETDDRQLLLARSPHIMMGNLYVAKNVRKPNIEDWFNLSKNIICINSINENNLNRLNGADFDSDFAMVTDNQALIKATNTDKSQDITRGYDKYIIPYNDIEPTGNKKLIDDEGKLDLDKIAEVDHALSNNNIGRIVDTSQKVNTLIWHIFSKTRREYEQVWRPYFLDAILEVLSNVEIDAAKHEVSVDSKSVLSEIDKQINQMVQDKSIFDDDSVYSLKKDDATIIGMKPMAFFKAKEGREKFDDKPKYFLFFDKCSTAKKYAKSDDAKEVPPEVNKIKNAKYYNNQGKKAKLDKINKITVGMPLDFEDKIAKAVLRKTITDNRKIFELIPYDDYGEGKKSKIDELKHEKNPGVYWCEVYIIYIEKDFSKHYYTYDTPMDRIYSYIKRSDIGPEIEERYNNRKNVDINNYLSRDDSITRYGDDVIEFLKRIHFCYKNASKSQSDINSTTYLTQNIHRLQIVYSKVLNDESKLYEIISALINGFKYKVDGEEVKVKGAGKSLKDATNFHYLVLYVITTLAPEEGQTLQTFEKLFKSKKYVKNERSVIFQYN